MTDKVEGQKVKQNNLLNKNQQNKNFDIDDAINKLAL